MNELDEKEILTDNVLLLYLIERVHDKSRRYLGITKLQKLVFMAEKLLNEKRIKAFNYDFFMWDYGPLSKNIYMDYKNLEENDIICENRNISLSKRGKDIVGELKEILERNRDILGYIDNVIEEFADYDTVPLERHVHNLTINVAGYEKPVRIDDLSKGTDIISGIDEKDAEICFRIDDAWIETLEILMDKGFYEALKESEKDAVEGRVVSPQEVL